MSEPDCWLRRAFGPDLTSGEIGAMMTMVERYGGGKPLPKSVEEDFAQLLYAARLREAEQEKLKPQPSYVA